MRRFKVAEPWMLIAPSAVHPDGTPHQAERRCGACPEFWRPFAGSRLEAVVAKWTAPQSHTRVPEKGLALPSRCPGRGVPPAQPRPGAELATRPSRFEELGLVGEMAGGGHLPAGVTGSLPPCRPATGLRTRRLARAAGEPVCRRGRTPLGAPAQGGPQGLGLGSGLQCRAARHILPCHPLPRHLWGALVPKGTTSREP